MWIAHVPYGQSSGRLRQLYDRVKGPDDNVDNIMLAHSLRPHSMEGHMALYKYVLHHTANTVPKWFLETLGVYTSLLNGCAYCVEHHFAGLARLVGETKRSDEIRHALDTEDFTTFDVGQREALAYARVLTRTPADEAALKTCIAAMRTAGLSDGAILEINQVVAYFAYANRTVLGLGVSMVGDVLGLSPSNSADPNDWTHR